MRKTPLSILIFYASILASFSQSLPQNDTTEYKDRKLKVEEVNFVSGYYQQDGNHSGVTGGIGTENLTDIAGSIDLKLSKVNARGNKNSLIFEMGIDLYTSASSDNIDPRAEHSADSSHIVSISGPSRQDTRIYPSLFYSSENPQTGITLGAGVSYSHEYDYESRGVSLNFVKSSKDNNREFGVKLFAFFDQWTAIYPVELRPPGYGSGSHDDPLPVDILPRNSYQASFIFSQVLNHRMQMALLFDPAYQNGQLTTLYQRVYFNDNSVHVEKLPSTRIKIPIGIRFNYFIGDRFIIRSYYRFYHDDWGNAAHTANLETPFKITPFFSLIPFYLFSVQSGIDYFAAKYAHNMNETYYTSDYDLSPFNSQFIGLGVRLAPPKGILGVKFWNSLELRYGHYIRSTDLVANSVTLALKFK